MQPVKVSIGSYRGQSWLSKRIALFSAPLGWWPQVNAKHRLPSHSFLQIEFEDGTKEVWETHAPAGWRRTEWAWYEDRIPKNPKRWLVLEDLHLPYSDCKKVLDVCIKKDEGGIWQDYPEKQIFEMMLNRWHLGKVSAEPPPVCSEAVALVLWEAIGIDLRIWHSARSPKARPFQELSPWWIKYVPKKKLAFNRP